MIINTNKPEYKNDFFDIVRLFGLEKDDSLSIDICYEANSLICKIANEIQLCEPFELSKGISELKKKRLEKRAGKNIAYRALVLKTGKRLSWGSLTGIRPAVLGYEFLAEGGSIDGVADYLVQTFDVSQENAQIVCDIIKNQQSILYAGVASGNIKASGTQKKPRNIFESAGLYINIPVCASRCDYCSFISSTLDKCKNIESYADYLSKEILLCLEIIERKGYILRSVYVGGGTPTSIDSALLDLILRPVSEYIQSKGRRIEFCVEAGRPDSISIPHLDVLKNRGVTRISINPQTFNDRTLELIGRRHRADDVQKAFEMARSCYPFDINMDLIAGLQGETLDDFRFSLDKTLSLMPENITIHTLCYKRGSLRQAKNEGVTNRYATEMIEYSKRALKEGGYFPYYLYRQKNALDNLENMGYSKQGKQCIHNIDTMEETAHIIAAGAGAISKRLFFDNEKGNEESFQDQSIRGAQYIGFKRIERIANPKFIDDYLERFKDITLKKAEFWY